MAFEPSDDLTFGQTRNHRKVERHVHIAVYTTFSGQNHGRVERLRPDRDPRHAAADHLGGRPQRSALAQTDSADFKNRPEGIRIKHRVDDNSLKAYDKAGNCLRVETTMNEPSDFKVFRTKETDPDGKPEWLPYAAALPMSIGAPKSVRRPMNAISMRCQG
jgi:hypothetical protein